MEGVEGALATDCCADTLQGFALGPILPRRPTTQSPGDAVRADDEPALKLVDTEQITLAVGGFKEHEGHLHACANFAA